MTRAGVTLDSKDQHAMKWHLAIQLLAFMAIALRMIHAVVAMDSKDQHVMKVLQPLHHREPPANAKMAIVRGANASVMSDSLDQPAMKLWPSLPHATPTAARMAIAHLANASVKPGSKDHPAFQHEFARLPKCGENRTEAVVRRLSGVIAALWEARSPGGICPTSFAAPEPREEKPTIEAVSSARLPGGIYPTSFAAQNRVRRNQPLKLCRAS
ncbi:hypothetical protein NDU88_000866 [Pleurodeles waltl]|uniref:Uncharacterized protein n=1 Tax=Pleurodeles waltl TaxID=8319 RepID=A0AAV7SYK6_PLEWA|nr:hypothetical protein NDU88_000866 [Pleurodeles waltl]